MTPSFVVLGKVNVLHIECSFLRKTRPLNKECGGEPTEGRSHRPALSRAPREGRKRGLPPNTSCHCASRTGPEASLGGVSGLLRKPQGHLTPASQERNSVPDLCRPPPGLEGSLSSLGEPLRATRSSPSLHPPRPAERAPHPSSGLAAPPHPSPGGRFTGRPREYSRRPRAARGRR